jgi:hypothetical protein
MIENDEPESLVSNPDKKIEPFERSRDKQHWNTLDSNSGLENKRNSTTDRSTARSVNETVSVWTGELQPRVIV